MRSYRYMHLDVFTRHLFGGNQLCVFLDARGLTPDEMQAIAKEINFSETTFIFPPERPDTDVRVRMFTPAEELPMAGHPTIGTAFALARAGVLQPGQERVVFGLGVGPTNVSLSWRDDDLNFAWMTQLNPTFGEPIADRAGASAVLRLHESDLAAGLPVQTVSCGVPFLMVPIQSRHSVDDASLDGRELTTFSRAQGLDHHAVFLFSTDAGSDRATAYSRMFAPAFGIGEDPATGSASGPLGCYLVRHNVVPPEKAVAIRSLQGVKMGRPSDVHVSIGVTRGDITSVRVGGEAVLAGEGTLYV
jgi:trans-2,3-dihydro-3-hydroxyanthranilate isomerase